MMTRLRNKTLMNKGLTLLEMIISLAIIVTIFAVMLPQFRTMSNSWATKQTTAEAIQNGRILTDRLNRSLTIATRITAVSGPAETNGYIEFEGNDGTIYRYDIGPDNYVRYGPPGNLNDLGGPVSRLQFTCYDAYDLDTPIINPDNIRCVKADITVTNAGTGLDRAFTAQGYLRTNASQQISESTLFEFDALQGKKPALEQVNSTLYLCAYTGYGNDGWVALLRVNTSDWTISKDTDFEFDSAYGNTPALAKISATRYLCAYTGPDYDGWARVLSVNVGTSTISSAAPFEFDSATGMEPALAKIDNTHYLCAYGGPNSDGWAVVLTVNNGDWSLSKGTAFEFETSQGTIPDLTKIDDTHYLCAYSGPGTCGWAVVLTVDTAGWSISKETPYEFEASYGNNPALAQIDADHYLCAYGGSNLDGWAVVLAVDTSTWQITKGTAFEFDNYEGKVPTLCKIDTRNYLCAYEGSSWLIDIPWAVILNVNLNNWTISKKSAPFQYADEGDAPELLKVDDNHYLCAFDGMDWDGWAVVIEVDVEIKP